jgi:branched-chain amino acid transport system ATP-binding protein
MNSLLRLSSVSKRFGGLQALSDVSFAVEAGEILAIIGPNGAGKTTLFNCIAGATAPTSGEILLDGHRIDGLRPHQLCERGLARTFQIVKPFRGMTVLENVKVAALSQHRSAAAAEAAASAMLEQLGMLGVAAVDAEELTVAELRRLEIARALATRPRLLLLDEMLAGLTVAEAAEMCDRIRRLPEDGIAVVVVEHSVPIVSRLCSRAVVLDFGRVLMEGPTADVIADPRTQAAYLGTARP